METLLLKEVQNLKEQKQELIDIAFACCITMDDALMSKTNEEKAKWVAKQLKGCGYNTQPIGASWGILTTK